MQTVKIILALVLVVSASIAGVLWLGNSVAEQEQAQVATTIFPLYDITQQIAGDTLHVTLIVPPGTSTHTFESTPSAIRKLEGVEVVYAVGHGADDWSNAIADSIGAETVVVDESITVRATAESDHEDEDEHENEHGPTDPHYWLTLPNGILIAEQIAEDLSQRFPEHAETFAANLETYREELQEAEAEAQTWVQSIEDPHIVTLHDAWYYFANAYGLEVAGTVEPSAGREPSPQYLTELIHTTEETGAQIVYSEPQLATEKLEAFADDNGLTIAVLDPIGGIEGRETFIDLILYNVRTIAQNQ